MATTTFDHHRRKRSMASCWSPLCLLESFAFAYSALKQNWGRAVLTSLGMVVGTASLILVVTVGISGREYIMNQIRGVGSNLIYAYYEASDTASGAQSLSDFLTMSDLEAIRDQVPGVENAAPIVLDHDSITINGVPRLITLIGTTPAYMPVRNIEIVQGRFIDSTDEELSSKVCVVTPQLYAQLAKDPAYRGYLQLYGLRFNVIGVFKERVSTFGQSEVSTYSAVLPLSVMWYFRPNRVLDQIYVSATSMAVVPQVSREIKQLLKTRHGGAPVYRVENLTEILKAASKISTGLTVILLIIAAISLMSSGVGIMNIMLITVTERTREIGIKKAVGATRDVILTQFLIESLLLSFTGGVLGIIVGVAIPLIIGAFVPQIQITVSGLSIVVGFAATLAVGLTFGLLPASRASRLDPVEALRHE